MRVAALLLTGMLLWSSAIAGHAWGVQIASMRCGRSLITVGDHAYTLLDLCGDPDYRSTVGLIEYSDRLSGCDDHIIHSVSERAVVVTEEWVYKQGRGRLTKILTVTGGVLTDIRIARR